MERHGSVNSKDRLQDGYHHRHEETQGNSLGLQRRRDLHTRTHQGILETVLASVAEKGPLDTPVATVAAVAGAGPLGGTSCQRVLRF